MSSIIFHLCMSKVLNEQNNFSKNFLAGAIAPDIYKKYVKNRDETHYIQVYKKNGTIQRLPNIDKFFKEYEGEHDSYFYGYLCHLIQDKIWFSKYIPRYALKYDNNRVKYIKDNSIHNGNEFSKEIYLDYATVDRFILQKVDIDLFEIRKYLKEYFHNEQIDKIIDDEVRLFEQIEGRPNYFLSNDVMLQYFEECIEECNKYINERKQ